MVRTLPPSMIAEKNRIETPQAWMWLFEVFFAHATLVLHLVNNEEAIEFGGDTYQPFPIGFKEIEETSQGDLPTVTIMVGNVSQEIMSFLEEFDGMRDEKVTIRLVNTATNADATAKVESTFRIRSASADHEKATFELAVHPMFELDWPYQRFLRQSCRWRFGSRECGWGFTEGIPGIVPPQAVVDAGNNSSSCDKTLNGANGCVAHGLLYSTAGETSLWPRRAGFFPLIPKPRRGP